MLSKKSAKIPQKEILASPKINTAFILDNIIASRVFLELLCSTNMLITNIIRPFILDRHDDFVAANLAITVLFILG
jgi:hypothetical protein